MSIEIKYKLGDLAKDLGAASKDIIEMLSALERGEAKKHTTPLAENELNLCSGADDEKTRRRIILTRISPRLPLPGRRKKKKQRPKEKLTVSANAGPLKKADGTIVEMPAKHKEKARGKGRSPRDAKERSGHRYGGHAQRGRKP